MRCWMRDGRLGRWGGELGGQASRSVFAIDLRQGTEQEVREVTDSWWCSLSESGIRGITSQSVKKQQSNEGKRVARAFVAEKNEDRGFAFASG
jgi:hypothetical protein